MLQLLCQYFVLKTFGEVLGVRNGNTLWLGVRLNSYQQLNLLPRSKDFRRPGAIAGRSPAALAGRSPGAFLFGLTLQLSYSENSFWWNFAKTPSSATLEWLGAIGRKRQIGVTIQYKAKPKSQDEAGLQPLPKVNLGFWLFIPEVLCSAPQREYSSPG